MRSRSAIKKLGIAVAVLLAIYGANRLYFVVTGGFSVDNITSNLAYDSRWNTRDLTTKEKREVELALNQEYLYLGKGCQSYVFASQDGNYVIKFFKYQRFRPKEWINFFRWIPLVNRYQQAKVIEKRKKLDNIFRSWKISFEHLKNETAVLYVHLNKAQDNHPSLVISDKMGMKHSLQLDQMEFLLQRKATMLASSLSNFVMRGFQDQAIMIVDKLLTMLLSEYFRGFADNDHALMQNTGVIGDSPIHIDVGQFIYNEVVKAPEVFKQEIYNKTYKLHLWLEKHHPEIDAVLRARLVALLGINYFYMSPYVHKGDVGKIPNQGR